MKKITILMAAVALYCSACGSNKKDENGYNNSTDSAGQLPPVPSNSDATNPSLGDTSFHTADSAMHVDTMNK